MRHATLTLALTLLLTTAHANPWAERYDSLCLADPYTLHNQQTDPQLAEHAHNLATSTLDHHGITYQHGPCDTDRSFTLVLSLLLETTKNTANLTFGLHTHAPELYDALHHITLELREIHDDDTSAVDALDAAFTIIDAYSIHIDASSHHTPNLDAILEDARARHQWLLNSFALSWLGEI